MDHDTMYGYVAAFISIIFFGSFALPMKSRRVVDANVDPVVFQLYYSFAIFVTSWLALAYEHHTNGSSFEFTYLGIVGAALWVPASILSIFAIKFIGLSIAQGVWSGVTIVVSFLLGAFVFHDQVKSVVLAVFALLLLMIGVAGLSLCKNRFYFFAANTGYGQIQDEETTPLGTEATARTEASSAARNKVLGMACAMLLGLFNGSLMVPTKHLPASISSLMYVANFGIGVMVVTPVVAALYFLIKMQVPVFKPRQVALLACVSGCLWNVGNVASIIATEYLGMTIGYPLSQLALLVAGLWGMFLFQEITGTSTRLQFFAAAAVLLLGALLLSLSH